MTIYERIKQLRIKNNMSQYELAKKVGYEGRSAISKVENGDRDISQSMIAKYADALGVTPSYLLYGNDNNETSHGDSKNESTFELVNNDPELTEYLEQLKNRAEMRMLFSLAKDATKADVEKAVKIVEALFDKKD